MLLLLHVLAAGVAVGHVQQLADGVIGVFLHPAVGVVHPDHPAHPVVGVGGGSPVALSDGGQIVHPVILIGDFAVVRVGDGGLVAVAVVVVLDHIALVVGDLLQLAEQIILKGVDTCPVLHPDQIAHRIVGVVHLFATIIIDMGDHIKPIVGVLE